MNVLCVVAHPDDELFGCGATLRRLRDEGHNVYTCVLCGPADARHGRPELERLRRVAAEASAIAGVQESVQYEFKNIQFNVVPHLDMVRAIEETIVRFRPDWIFTHHGGDLNVDHRVCYETTMSAILLPQRMSSGLPVTQIKRVYLFEVLSSTDWAPPTEPGFRPNSFFDVSATMDRKLAALDAFEGALKPAPHSRSRENVLRLAQLRGAQVGIELAEAFVIVRDLN